MKALVFRALNGRGLALAMAGVLLSVSAAEVRAQDACTQALTGLELARGGNPAAIIAGWGAVQQAGCDDGRLLAARAQTSALMAQAAQGALASGNVDEAEELVLQAPGVHWAVQAVRGDIAAKRGNREEAARMYNNALDTLGDPGQTAQNPALEPVAQRLAALAQENMMLAGSMESTVTRGGGSSGLMGMVSRGLAIEKVAQVAEAQPAQPGYVPPPAPPGYVPPPAGDAGAAYVPPPAAPVYAPPPPPAPVYNVIEATAQKTSAVFLPIRFGFDSDRLDDTGLREGLRLAEFLKANQVAAMVITGHTDDVGDANYNLDLSLRRAASLRDFLLAQHVPTRIDIIGKGESQPPLYTDQAAYSLDELRTIARRVEVALAAY